MGGKPCPSSFLFLKKNETDYFTGELQHNLSYLADLWALNAQSALPFLQNYWQTGDHGVLRDLAIQIIEKMLPPSKLKELIEKTLAQENCESGWAVQLYKLTWRQKLLKTTLPAFFAFMQKQKDHDQYYWANMFLNVNQTESGLLTEEEESQLTGLRDYLKNKYFSVSSEKNTSETQSQKQSFLAHQKQAIFFNLEKELPRLNNNAFGELLEEGHISLKSLYHRDSWQRLLTLPSETCRHIYNQNIAEIVDLGYQAYRELAEYITEKGENKSFLIEDNALMEYFLTQPPNEETLTKINNFWLPTWDENVNTFIERYLENDNPKVTFSSKQQEYLFLTIPLLKQHFTAALKKPADKQIQKGIRLAYVFLANNGNFIWLNSYQKITQYLAQDQKVREYFQTDLQMKTPISLQFAWRLAFASPEPQILTSFLKAYEKQVDQLASYLVYTLPPQRSTNPNPFAFF